MIYKLYIYKDVIRYKLIHSSRTKIIQVKLFYKYITTNDRKAYSFKVPDGLESIHYILNCHEPPIRRIKFKLLDEYK